MCVRARSLCAEVSLELGVSSILHFLKLSFSLNLELAVSAASSASAPPALGLQTCTAVCGFYMHAGGH